MWLYREFGKHVGCLGQFVGVLYALVLIIVLGFLLAMLLLEML